MRHAEAQAAAEPGLAATYYNNKNFTAPTLTRTDPQINFSWGKGSPSRRIDPDTFSARWTGQVQAPSSGTYTFYTYTSDGVRLWVDGELVVGAWRTQSAREWSGEISLQAGERYPIKMEYFEGSGRATAKLLWSGPGLAKQVIPSDRLSTPDAPSTAGERWSDPATWGGAVPSAGEAVTIPMGKTVVLDTSPPPLKSLQIDGTLVHRQHPASGEWSRIQPLERLQHPPEELRHGVDLRELEARLPARSRNRRSGRGDPATGMDGDTSSVFLDTDGSVTGTAGRYVVANNPFLLNEGCGFRTAWNAHVCQAEYVTLTVGRRDGDLRAITPLTLRRADGVTQTLWGCCDDSTSADSSVFPNQGYEVTFDGGTPQRMIFVLTRGQDRWVRLTLDYPVTPKVSKYGCDLADSTKWCKGGAGSVAELDAMTKSGYYYDPEAKKLHLKLVSTNTDYEELQVDPSPQ